jgi:uncharacterized protein YdeI (BOF family)
MTRQMLIAALLVLLIAAPAFAQAEIIYTGTAQPSLDSVTLTGAQLGTTVTMDVNGINLGGASEVIFNKPGLTAKILAFAERLREKPKVIPQTPVFVDKSILNRVTLEIAVATSVEPGIYRFRLKTPMGTTNSLPFAVTPFPETAERGMNQSIETAQQVSLPACITGNIGRRGEADYYMFKAQAGQQIVFEPVTTAIGSQLNPVITLFDGERNQLAMNDKSNLDGESPLGYTFKAAGAYFVSITDAEREAGFVYRLNLGEFPYITGAFPLGIKQGAAGEVALSGFNLSGSQKVTAPAMESRTEEWMIRGNSAKGESLNRLKLDAGRYPEIIESGNNNTPTSAQAVEIPVTINGRIFNSNGSDRDKSQLSTAEDYYRFRAKKGQKLIFEVAAQRFGSPLDSVIEVLDARGLPIQRAVLRSLLATEMTLSDRDSFSAGFRLLNWSGMRPGDYLLVGSELVQIERLPFFPDDDTIVVNADGLRYGFEDTTPEAHAMGTPVYKVSVHPPGSTFSSNGLPVVTLYYRNDDAGPLYGFAGMKDSRLTFTAPGDGEYVVRIRDMRGLSGERFAYRLAIHEPQPDFSLAIEPENPNVPLGGSRDLRVRAIRWDGFDGEIEVKLLNVPAGFTATTAKIPPGHRMGVVILSAAPGAMGHFSLRAEGAATIKGQHVVREAPVNQAFEIVSVAPPPELLVFTKERQVEVAPGDDAFVNISIKRQEGFGGRVPFDVVGLPPGVTLRDLGLNGILITEGETATRFRFDVQPWVQAQERQIFIVGRIETSGRQQPRFPAAPITLSIKAKERTASSRP